MTGFEYYKNLLVKTFGTGTTSFVATGAQPNNLIGALGRPDFAPFTEAFGNRLRRLAGLYPDSNPDKRHLLETLNEVASERNWQGAYAELVAFDYLNSDQDWLGKVITLHKMVSASETLATGFGKQHANFDGHYDDFGISFDVKVLSDKSRDILAGVIAKAKTAHGLTDVLINPEYPLDLPFESFQRNVRGVLEELVSALTPPARCTYFKSTVVPELAYRLMWGAGVLTTVHTYNPYFHAENHHLLLFKHVGKFSTIRPSLIVFVVFPWFSEQVLNQNEHSDVFYRALSRRFFCQYASNLNPATTRLKGFGGPETLSQITDKLSGVLFLEDRSITSEESSLQNVSAFAYLNPNAVFPVSGHFKEHLRSLKCFIDDFAHDNY